MAPRLGPLPGGTLRSACPVPVVGQVRPPPGAQWIARDSMRPSGRPTAVRPLCGPRWGPVGPGARVPVGGGVSAPSLPALGSFLGPGAAGLWPPPRFRALLPPGPGKPPPGPFRSRAAFQFGPRAAQGLQAGTPSPWPGFLCRRLLQAQGRGRAFGASWGGFPPPAL